MNETLTQQNTLLKELQKAGDQGVNSYYATYQMGIKQAPTRINELRKKYLIQSFTNSDRSVTWVLMPDGKPQDSKSKVIVENTYQDTEGRYFARITDL